MHLSHLDTAATLLVGSGVTHVTVCAPAVLAAVMLGLGSSVRDVDDRSPADVLTQRNDEGRTGHNRRERVLDPTTVRRGSFGRLVVRPVDGHIYAQPLVVSGVAAGRDRVGATRELVIVATEHNSVFAFDARDVDPHSSTSTVWHVGPEIIGPPVPSTRISQDLAGGPHRCVDLTPEVGITSTPAIRLEPGYPRRGAVFVVAKTLTGDGYAHTLVALNLADGRRLGPPTLIEGEVVGQDEVSPTRALRVRFDPKVHLNRPALTLKDDTLFVAFGSHCDRGRYQGWLFAYDVSSPAAPRLLDVFCTNPNAGGRRGGGAGIWMSGQGPVVDGAGSILLTTGDGHYDGRAAFGNSLLRLEWSRERFHLRDWFTPEHHRLLTRRDADLGSAGVVLIPGTTMVLIAGKEGRLYLLDRRRLGKGRHPLVHSVQVTNPPYPRRKPNTFWNIHGAPVVWKRADEAWVYVWGEEDRLKQYRLSRDARSTLGWSIDAQPIVSRESTPFPDPPHGRYSEVRRGPNAVWMPGAFLSLSSDGDRVESGILWASLARDGNASHTLQPGILRAYLASDVSRLLWDSSWDTRDAPGVFAKFCPPTVANGKVYLATFAPDGAAPGEPTTSAALVIYGQLDAKTD